MLFAVNLTIRNISFVSKLTKSTVSQRTIIDKLIEMRRLMKVIITIVTLTCNKSIWLTFECRMKNCSVTKHSFLPKNYFWNTKSFNSMYFFICGLPGLLKQRKNYFWTSFYHVGLERINVLLCVLIKILDGLIVSKRVSLHCKKCKSKQINVSKPQ